MTSDIIKATKRQERGKEVAKKLRQEGLIPSILYGGGKEPIALTVNQETFVSLIRHKGTNSIFNLDIKGIKEEQASMIHDYQVDPVTHKLMHIDFIRVVYGQKIHVSVPIELVGTPPGVKQGGFMDFSQRELELECLPSKIPHSIQVDISELNILEHVSVEDLEENEDYLILDDGHNMIIRISPPKVIEVEEEEAEEGEIDEESAEPEVLTKSRKEEVEE